MTTEVSKHLFKIWIWNDDIELLTIKNSVRDAMIMNTPPAKEFSHQWTEYSLNMKQFKKLNMEKSYDTASL